MRRFLVPILVVTGAAGGYVLTDSPAASQVSTGVDRPQVDYPALAAEYDYTLAVATEEVRIQAEAEAAAAAARALRDQEAARIASGPPVGPQMASVASGAGCESSVLPAYIAWRESRCSYDAINASSGAYGMYQIMPMHWNPGGVCDDLDRTVPANQDSCALRLSQGGTNLAPWSG